MKCPSCGDPDSRVIDSRSSRDDLEIRRRRQCDACSGRFTTYERIERSLPSVVKKDNRREPWNRQKIVSGLKKACEKRPISIEEIETVAHAVESNILKTGELEISSELIGKKIMAELKILDQVAYVRFASVYRSFKDIDEFMSELSGLIKNSKKS